MAREGEPMSDERLREIRQHVRWFEYGENDESDDMIHDLLAEHDRLCAELAAAREREAAYDDLLGLAMAVADGWPNDTAPARIREDYIEALRNIARDLTETYAERVASLRARNAAELASESVSRQYNFPTGDLSVTCTTATGTFRLQGSTTPPPTAK